VPVPSLLIRHNKYKKRDSDHANVPGGAVFCAIVYEQSEEEAPDPKNGIIDTKVWQASVTPKKWLKKKRISRNACTRATNRSQ
jgi:hypothetical protein